MAKQNELLRQQFLSTPSARRATCELVRGHVLLFISIHALREEGDSSIASGASGLFSISIHALREEGDFVPLMQFNRLRNISIHALREEGDVRNRIDIAFPGNFYPRPPRGGRPERSE